MNKKGFTLIEILIVVSIIGLLASMVLVGLRGVSQRGRDAKRLADLKQIQTGLELYYSAQGQYPSADSNGMPQGLEGNYGIDKLPTPPTAGEKYGYCADAGHNNQTYVMSAQLEDVNNAALKNNPTSPSCTPSNVSCTGIGQGGYCVIN